MKKLQTKMKNKEIITRQYDTEIKIIEEQYGVDFGVREDMKLGDFFKKRGYPSLAKMLKV